LLVLAGCAEPPPWEFVSKEHKFKVRFGSEPVVTKGGAFTKNTIYSVERPDGALTVVVMELPDEIAPENVPLLLKKAKEQALLEVNGTETSDSTAPLAGKHPGREFTATFQGAHPGVLRARVCLVGKRLYQVMVLGTEEFVNSRNAKAFWESFVVTE
jgi:hypothetical protein